jgi:ribosome-associated heat shock protein Hsp15
MDRVRIDKWLWAARFFKTRTLAAHACDLGRIHFNEQPVKPARDIRTGDVLQVKNDSGDFVIEVLALSDMRGPASVAQALYRETDESRAARLKAIEDRRLMPHYELVTEGRPSKRDRRQLSKFRGRN